MRILLDEDVPRQVLEVLRHVLRDHSVDHVTVIKWSGKQDEQLYHDAAKKGYNVVITNNIDQLDNPGECRAIKRSGIHWVGYRQRHPGLKGLALAIASIIAASTAVVEELNEASGQRLVQITGIDPKTRRHKCIDPQRNPPRYWR